MSFDTDAMDRPRLMSSMQDLYSFGHGISPQASRLRGYTCRGILVRKLVQRLVVPFDVNLELKLPILRLERLEVAGLKQLAEVVEALTECGRLGIAEHVRGRVGDIP
jgi:hypothetical protein